MKLFCPMTFYVRTIRTEIKNPGVILVTSGLLSLIKIEASVSFRQH